MSKPEKNEKPFLPLTKNLKSMAETFYYIKTKDATGEAEIEALNKTGKIEILPPDFIPQWQQEESLRRLAAMKAHPEKNISLEETS